MDKKTYLKIFSKKGAFIGSLILSVITSIFLGSFFYDIGIWLLPIIAIFLTSFIFNYYFFIVFTKSMIELGEYWDNLILYDNKFLPDIKKKYKQNAFKSRIHPFRIVNYQMSGIKPIIIMVLIMTILINIVIIYWAVIPSSYEFKAFLLQMLFFSNITFLAILIFIYIIFLAVSPLYSKANMTIVRENDLLIISHIGQYLMKNSIPYTEIKKARIIRKIGNRSSHWNMAMLIFEGKYHHPQYGLYFPTLGSTDLVEIGLYHPLKILQTGRLVRNKKPKQYDYILTDKILVEPKNPKELVSKINISIKEKF